MKGTVAIVLLAVLASACGGAEPTVVARRLGGVRRIGAFVSPHSYEYFIRGELAALHGDLETAANAYDLARAGATDDPLLIARYADALDRLGRHDDADAALEEGDELDPRSEAVALARARIEERRGHVEAAIAAYEHAERVAPRSDVAPLELAQLLRENGAEARSDAVLVRFARRAGRGSQGALRARLQLALARGDGATAGHVAQALLRTSPARSSEIHRAAEAALEAGESALAARLADALPRTDEHATIRVRTLVAAGRLAEAEGVLASFPSDVFGGPLEEARFLLEVGRADRAEELALSAGLGANRIDAWLIGGLAYLAQGRYADAAEQLARVPRGVTGFAEARIALADAAIASGMPNLAIELLEATLAGSVDDELAVRRALAHRLVDAGEPERARVVAAEADGAAGLALLARVLERTGRVEEAIATWVRVDPRGDGLERREIARAHAEQLLAGGDVDGAMRTLERLSARTPGDLEARLRTIEIAKRRGEDVSERAVALAPLLFDASHRARLAAAR